MPFAAPQDRGFLSYFDLDRPDLAEAKRLAETGALAAASASVLRAVERGGLSGYLSPAEAPLLGKAIAADRPEAVEQLRRYVALADELREPGAPKTDFLASAAAYREALSLRRDASHGYPRGRIWYALAQLFCMTGEPRWASAAAKLPSRLPALDLDPEAYGEFIPVLAWHPGCPKGLDALSVAHVLQNMAVALPMLWTGLEDDARKLALAYAACHAEILHRAMRSEPPYNIPLHGLVAALGIAALAPQLKGAPRWKQTLDTMLSPNGAYVSPPFATPDGYCHEGLGYQKVDQFLLTRCLLLYERAWGGAPEPLRALVAAGYALAAGSLRPDGSSFAIGDHQHQSPHEHEIEHHEVLHLGAALFDKPEWKARAGGLGGTLPPSLLCFLMGAEGYARWRRMPAANLSHREHAPFFLKDAGFLHLRAGRGVRHACHGLLNASLAVNHGHHDLGGVTLYALGRELVSDPGMLGYSLVDTARFRDPLVHAVARLGHTAPLGPRHERFDLVTKKGLAQSPDSGLQIAWVEHRLWPDLVARRVVVLCLPTDLEDPARGAGAWLIWDRIAHAKDPEGREPPQGHHRCARISDTAFPLHAPGGEARVEGRDGWSRHRGTDRLVHLETGLALNLTCAEASAALEVGESEANVQVSALETAAPGASVGLTLDEGWLGHFHFLCARPLLRFLWRGPLPHEAAYVMLPFEGLADEAPFAVAGRCARPAGALSAVVTPRTAHARAVWPEPLRVQAEGLAGERPRVVFERNGQLVADLRTEV